MDKKTISSAQSQKGNCMPNGMCVSGTGEACKDDKDCCPPGKYGPFPVCDWEAATCQPECKNGSYCSPELGTCVCPTDYQNVPLYWGKDCGNKVCPSLCNGDNGYCNPDTGVCTCYRGYSGEDCGTLEKASCLKGSNGLVCSGNGTCDDVTGECMCNSSYSGQTCENKKSDPVCMGGGCGIGTCTTDGTCICPINTSGTNCQTSLMTKATHTSWQTIAQRIIIVVLIIALAVMLILLFTGKLEKYSKLRKTVGGKEYINIQPNIGTLEILY